MCKKKIGLFLPKQIIKNDRLSNFTTFKIGGRANIICPRTILEFVKTLKVLDGLNVCYKVIGAGSNLLADSKPHKTIYVCTAEIGEDFIINQNQITVSAGANINQVILFCRDNNLSGLENLFGIPATIGGMVVTNAGAFGVNIFDKLVEIKVYKNQKVESVNPAKIKKQNHWTELINSGTVVLSATFELSHKDVESISNNIRAFATRRSQTQPKGNSAGCVFSNPKGESAGRLLDQAGLKGQRVGKAIISDIHANFIISEHANSKDVLQLVLKAQKQVYQKFGIWLVPEIEFIGDKNDINRRLSHPQ